MRTSSAKAEFGDFQTPYSFAKEVCSVLVRDGFQPASVVEPTCGIGSFLEAASEGFPSAVIRGYEYRSSHVESARKRLLLSVNAGVVSGDFFEIDWDAELAHLADPILVLGNPPWATNSAIGSLGGSNLPRKSNVDGLRGIDALTGKANFDISEWMIRENLRWLQGRSGAIAVLCKTSVARKILVHAWALSYSVTRAKIYRIDAKRIFGAAVDACLLYLRLGVGSAKYECEVYDDLDGQRPGSTFGIEDDALVSDLATYRSLRDLRQPALGGWRSGLKHDCSRVFEFSVENGQLVNGFGESTQIEEEVLFPLLKSSDVARGRQPRKYVLIPHRSMSESAEMLQSVAPNAWNYLVSYDVEISRRASSIFRKRSRFSVFGVGPYSFSPWKVAISGLYKHFSFAKVGPHNGSPVLFDDTCYFFSCDDQEECDVLFDLVSSRSAIEYFSSLVFWDSKRPITASLLNSLDLKRLAMRDGRWNPVARRLAERQVVKYNRGVHQTMLFREARAPYRSG